ncbi:MAG: hypothetical protein IK138_07305 [Lachnospiraceae bacterium]|nr:hypothetical protein [Lachnospiraceae bacterium]
MKLYKIKILSALLLLGVILALSGCAENSMRNVFKYVELEKDAEVYAYINGNLFYEVLTEENIIPTTRLMQITPDGEIIENGRLDHYVAMKPTALDYPYLYSCRGIVLDAESNNPQVRNSVVAINIPGHNMDVYTHPEKGAQGQLTYVFNQEVVTIREYAERNGKQIFGQEQDKPFDIVSIIESFDPQTNMWKTRKKSVRSSVTGNGEIYIGLCTGKERLFAVRLVIKDNSKTTYLDVLNLDYEVEYSMVIEPEVFEWSGSYLIADMQMYGEYLYIYFPFKGILFHIEDRKLVEIHRDDDFAEAANPLNTDPVFFKRRGNSIFLLSDKGQLQEHKLNIPKDFYILNIVADKDSCLCNFTNNRITYRCIIGRNLLIDPELVIDMEKGKSPN